MKARRVEEQIKELLAKKGISYPLKYPLHIKYVGVDDLKRIINHKKRLGI